MDVVFDPDDHTYVVNGETYPSVTTVLAERFDEFRHVPAERLAHAAARGRSIHAALDLHNRCELDLETLDPAIRPFLWAWDEFEGQSAAIVLASELIVVSTRLRYAGTLDLILRLRTDGDSLPYLVDVKTGAVPASVGPQTAAYAMAYAETTTAKHNLPIRRAVLQLRPNGTYLFRDLLDPSDFAVFTNCLNLWKERHAQPC